MRVRRERLGLRQKEFGDRIDMQASTVSQLEHGTRVPSVQALGLLSEALDVDPNWLLHGRPTFAHGVPEGVDLMVELVRSSAVEAFDISRKLNQLYATLNTVLATFTEQYLADSEGENDDPVTDH